MTRSVSLTLTGVASVGFPHAVIQDDVYEGYFIPKGSMVLVNAWSVSLLFISTSSTNSCVRQLLHDPKVYSDPHAFNPERFLGSNPERDPKTIAFGFGRRICPGILDYLHMNWAVNVNLSTRAAHGGYYSIPCGCSNTRRFQHLKKDPRRCGH